MNPRDDSTENTVIFMDMPDVLYEVSDDSDFVTITDKNGTRTVPVVKGPPRPPIDYSKIKRPF